jgi:transcriptional regulator with XRE-family HTH domain
MSIFYSFSLVILIYWYMLSHVNTLLTLGNNLRQARKQRFPNDDLRAFALRIGVSRATLQRMEKGELSVTLGKYFRAAEVLGLGQSFDALLKPQESLFDD